jgi:hypothetical protein
MICSPASLSFKTTTPNSDAVTGSTIATIEATAGAVWFRPTIWPFAPFLTGEINLIGGSEFRPFLKILGHRSQSSTEPLFLLLENICFVLPTQLASDTCTA